MTEISMTANKVVLGLQWGDEGKGKVIDLLSGQTDYVVRCQGGANAGHTVVVGDRKVVLHLLPSGALHDGAICIIGNGVVVDPSALVHELNDLGEAGKALEKRLFVSDRAHLVLPWHKLLDVAAEKRKGDAKVGTTLRGIGPAYGDKIARTGIRCGELRDMTSFEKHVRSQLEQVNDQLAALKADPVNIEDIVKAILPDCAKVAAFVADTADQLHKAVIDGRMILFEGAQGVLLDVDYGTYPFVTSSNTGIGGVVTGSGVSHKCVGEVIGIVKAYTTRVGSGPFPSELNNAQGEALRQRGFEFGATTGRPRRCGWIDLVALRFACRLNGVDRIALTKLDVLTSEKTIAICTGYRLDGKVVDTVPARSEDFARVEPIYVEMPGWSEDIRACRSFANLPEAAKNYVRYLEEHLGVPVSWIGTGPGRDEIIVT
jgi:adenylosuccinate synthase